MTIQGVTAYPLADLATTYDANLARQVGMSDLVQTADAITDHYRRDGYFLTRATVAPGSHRDGMASIVVYEGYIGEIVIDGNGADAVAPILNPLKARKALTIGELDRRLALASDIPGIKLTSRIEPMLDDPAQHRLLVTAVMDRFDGGAFADNRGTQAQGPWQVYVTAGVNSAIMAGDRMTVSGLTVPDSPDELAYGEWTYSAPLGEARVKAAVSGYRTDAPSGSTGWLSGRSSAASLSVSQAVVRGRKASVWATASLDVRQVEQKYQGVDPARERLSVVRASLAGRRKAGNGSLAGTAQVSQGVGWFGATEKASPQLTRNDATGQFTKLNLWASAYQDLGRYAGIYGELSAQWSDDPLLASEEFYVGGSGIGRAYNYGELGGDSGVAGSVELRLGWDPKPKAVTFFQLYGFVDGGRVSNKRPAGMTHADLSSAGLGTRITVENQTTFKLELAKPLSGSPLDRSDSGWRAFVSVSREF